MIILSYAKEKEETYKNNALMNWKLADLIGVSCSRLMSKENIYPSFKEAYPEFSNNPISEKDSMESQKRNNAAIIKSQIIAFEQYQKSQRGNKQ